MQSIPLGILHTFFGTLVGGNKPFEKIRNKREAPQKENLALLCVHLYLIEKKKTGGYMDGMVSD